MASIVVEFELFAVFPDPATCITSRQFRHESIYYSWTDWPLTMKAITGFWTSRTVQLILQRCSSYFLHIQDHHFETHRAPKFPWMAALINFPTAAVCEQLWEVCTDYEGSTNVLILDAVWWLIYTGEMEVYLHAFLISAWVVGDRWASRAGLVTPGDYWQRAGGT
jgi:hypothetical protein